MGGCMSSEKGPSVAMSAELDRKQRERQKQDSETIKLLLLGTGNSGKSTIYKQIVLSFGDGYSAEDRDSMLPVIIRNILTIIHILLNKHEELSQDDSLQVPPLPAGLVEKAQGILAFSPSESMDEYTGKIISQLWQTEALQKIYQLRFNRFQVPDSCPYFMEDVERFCAVGCVPNDQDLFRARAPTTGITQTKFTLQGNPMLLVDVGGQRNERRKWIHCFEGVTLILFVVGISEYDQTLYEDTDVNRLQESLNVFEESVNTPSLSGIDVVLFLNKIDLFREKLEHVPLTECMPEYEGDVQDFDQNIAHIKQKFQERNKNKNRKVYPFTTCATDTDTIRKLFESIRETIVRSSLKESNLLISN